MHIEGKLLKRKNRGNLRQLQILPELIDFASNDYLGLARSRAFAIKVQQEWGENKQLGSTGSRLLTGNSYYVQDLEDTIAQFHGYKAGLLFGCGYMANLGLLSTVAGEKDSIFFDSRVHASTLDGIRLGQAKALPFRHNDLEHLESRLKKSTQGDRFICIESIYSTDGSMAPLKSICLLARHYNAKVIVDEAHATGVCGPQGRGLVALHNLTSEIFAHIITFGKALGSYGSIILGSQLLKEALINFATPYIYTTALPFQVLTAIKCSYALFPHMDSERKHLQKLVKLTLSETHIHGIRVKGNSAAKKKADELALAGFDVRALLSPTVRRGEETLRICLHAFNTPNEIERLQCQIS